MQSVIEFGGHLNQYITVCFASMNDITVCCLSGYKPTSIRTKTISNVTNLTGTDDSQPGGTKRVRVLSEMNAQLSMVNKNTPYNYPGLVSLGSSSVSTSIMCRTSLI